MIQLLRLAKSLFGRSVSWEWWKTGDNLITSGGGAVVCVYEEWMRILLTREEERGRRGEREGEREVNAQWLLVTNQPIVEVHRSDAEIHTQTYPVPRRLFFMDSH